MREFSRRGVAWFLRKALGRCGPLLLFLGVLGAGVIAHSGEARADVSIDELIREALELPRLKPRKVESIRFGTRGTTLVDFALSPSDPNVIYFGSKLGFVFGTKDGGTSWTEGRLIVRRGRFFGSIRPNVISGAAPFSGQSTISGLQRRGFLKNRPTDIFKFPYKTTTLKVLDLDPSSPAYWNAIRPSFFSEAGDVAIRDKAGAGGGGDAARLGVGLKSNAKRLAGLLRRRGKQPAGMNLQLLLTMRGTEPTQVSKVAIHPTNPEVAFAATAMGLFRTSDGGYSWLNAFPGRNLRERRCNFIAFHPTDHNRMFLGTGQGLLVSEDGGEKFSRVSGTQLSSVTTLWVEFYREDPNIMYAGSTIGAFRSKDGGKTWKWVFFETLAAANVIRSIAIAPDDPDRVFLSTYDGLFRTEDGGASWKRSGAFLFTSIRLDRVLWDPNDRDHILCLTYFKVWESFDGGESWQALYLDDGEWSPRAMYFDPFDSKVMWLLTSHELLRIRPADEEEPRVVDERRLRVIFGKEPNLGDLMDATFRNFGVHRGERSALRNRARLQGIVPKLNVFGGYFSVRDEGDLTAFFAGPLTFGAGDSRAFRRQIERNESYYGAVLNWDFTSAIFHMEELSFGRTFGTSNRAYLNLKSEVDRLFEERKRLIAKILFQPSESRLEDISRMLRLEELTAHLDRFSGGLMGESLQAIERGTFFNEWSQE